MKWTSGVFCGFKAACYSSFVQQQKIEDMVQVYSRRKSWIKCSSSAISQFLLWEKNEQTGNFINFSHLDGEIP